MDLVLLDEDIPLAEHIRKKMEGGLAVSDEIREDLQCEVSQLADRANGLALLALGVWPKSGTWLARVLRHSSQ